MSFVGDICLWKCGPISSHDLVHFLTFLLMTVSLSDPCYTVLLNSLMGNRVVPLSGACSARSIAAGNKIGVMGMGQAREPWKTQTRICLCTPADAGNMRTTSKEWYEAFEHTPDEITMARIEQKHAEYFARMTALKWVRYWTRSFAPGNPAGTDFLIAHHDYEWNRFEQGWHVLQQPLVGIRLLEDLFLLA